jgi:hypothetical protein
MDRVSQAAHMNGGEGFGWSFYGFFAAAAAWVGCYFLWAARAGRRR